VALVSKKLYNNKRLNKRRNRGNRGRTGCYIGLVAKKRITQSMLENSLFYIVDCRRNINP